MAGRIFKTKTFNRWFKSTLLDDIALSAAVEEMERGLIDARLADGLYKKRLPLPGRGKRGSVRTVVCSKHKEVWFFLFGFLKNERADISPVEKKALKKLAEDLLGLSADSIEKMLQRGEIEEVRK